MKEVFRQYLESEGIPHSQEQLDQIEQFLKDLYLTNQQVNLTRVPENEAVVRHCIDSLLVHSLLSHGASLVDLGCGPGFPAWPLALFRPDLEVTALDSGHKPLEFLRSKPVQNLIVLEGRAEEVLLTEKYDVVLGRAFAALSIQLEVSARPAKLGGLIIPYRTPADLNEVERIPVEKLGLELVDIKRIPLFSTDAVRLFPVYKKIAPTNERYPRAWSKIKKTPL